MSTQITKANKHPRGRRRLGDYGLACLFSVILTIALSACSSQKELFSSGVKPDEGKGYANSEGGWEVRFEPGRTDPLENDPRFRDAFEKAEIKADQELKKRGIEPQLGYCHIFWQTKKRILRKDYKIDWKTPAELNPMVHYD